MQKYYQKKYKFFLIIYEFSIKLTSNMIKFGNETKCAPKFKFTETKPKKRTLVLDLNGTLIHSRREGKNKINYKNHANPDFSFKVSYFIKVVHKLNNLSRNYLF